MADLLLHSRVILLLYVTAIWAFCVYLFVCVRQCGPLPCSVCVLVYTERLAGQTSAVQGWARGQTRARARQMNTEAKGPEGGGEVWEGGGRKRSGSPNQPFILSSPSKARLRGNIRSNSTAACFQSILEASCFHELLWLDETMSGQSPPFRRKLWPFIRASKQNTAQYDVSYGRVRSVSENILMYLDWGNWKSVNTICEVLIQPFKTKTSWWRRQESDGEIITRQPDRP